MGSLFQRGVFRGSLRGRKRRRGLTWVEVAATLAGLFVLGILVLSALPTWKPPLLKASCSNSIKQTMLAMHLFQAMYKKLPGDKAKEAARFSMWAEILPQLDEVALYDGLNFKVGAPTVLEISTTGYVLNDPKLWKFGDVPEAQIAADGRIGAHRAMVLNPLPTLLCPADRTASICPSAVNYCPIVTARGAQASTPEGLKPIVSVWEADDETTFPLPTAPPAFAERVRMISLDNISDGTETTIGIVERVKGRFATGRVDYYKSQAVAGTLDSGFVVDGDGKIRSDNSRMVAGCNSGRAAADPANHLSGILWLQHTCAWMGCANLMGPPNSPPCKGVSPGRNLASAGIAPPSSYHSGGANVAFFDGHVDFLSNDTDLKVLHAFSTPNGGEETPPEKP